MLEQNMKPAGPGVRAWGAVRKAVWLVCGWTVALAPASQAQVVYRQTFGNGTTGNVTAGSYQWTAYRTSNTGGVENVTGNSGAAGSSASAGKYWLNASSDRINATVPNSGYNGANGRLFASKSNPGTGSWALYTSPAETAAINAGFSGLAEDLSVVSFDHGSSSTAVTLRAMVQVGGNYYVSVSSHVRSVGASGNYALADPNGAVTAAIQLSGGAEWLPLTGFVPGGNMGTIGSPAVAISGPVQAYGIHGAWNGTDATARIDNFTVEAAGQAVEVVVDNTDSARVTVQGGWTASSSVGGYHGSNYLHDQNGGKGSKWVRFTPHLAASNYQVFIRYVSTADRAHNVPVDVVHADGTDQLSVDQRTGGGTWVLLGTYRFVAGTNGHVTVGNAGTTNFVIADAVRFVPVSGPSDAEVMAAGLVSWRKPDGDGISCAECHGPAGYDVAVFNFNQADLRRATAPHLNDADADRIFAMIELLRGQNPPQGGLKDVATFRPFQPGGGVILGGVTASNQERDAAFGIHMQQNFQFATNRIANLTQARAARDQLVHLNIRTVPTGILFNRWSESVSRQGAQDGGKFAEWVTAIGQQMGANKAAFQVLEDAYIANPSDTNFWAMFHKIDPWAVADPVNGGPAVSSLKLLEKEKFKSNLVFQHEMMRLSRGLGSMVLDQDGIRPFADQVGQGSHLPFFWDVADRARANLSQPLSSHALRNQQTVWLGTGSSLSSQLNLLRPTWFWLGWSLDGSLRFSGNANATRDGEYFIQTLMQIENQRAHWVFFNAVHAIQRGFRPGAWGSDSNPQHFLGPKQFWLRHGFYNKPNDDPNYPGSAARYRFMLANTLRMFCLLHEQDIKDKGVVYRRTFLLEGTDSIEVMRTAMNWAEPHEQTLNNQIVNNLLATVAAYPDP
jgi:hypothetical protein